MKNNPTKKFYVMRKWKSLYDTDRTDLPIQPKILRLDPVH